MDSANRLARKFEADARKQWHKEFRKPAPEVITEPLNYAVPDFIDSLLDAVKKGDTAEVTKHLKDKEVTDRLPVAKIKELYRQIYGFDKELIEIRKDFVRYFKKMASCPLPCKGDKCDRCRTFGARSEGGKTCLPAVQELFLWSLHAPSTDMAVVFWERCEDKIASACIAWAVKTAMLKKKHEQDRRWQLEQDALQFQMLAISTLKRCHEVNSSLTESLLMKTCPWWNNFSVLQLVIGTENKDFMAQKACVKFMTRLWMGISPKGAGDGLRARGQTLVDAEPELGLCCFSWPDSRPFRYLTLPVVRYGISLGLHVLFLGLYSYVLLFCNDEAAFKNTSSSILFSVLIIWVMDIAADELRQTLNPNPTLNADCCEFKKHCKSYWRQSWNWLDVTTIVLFGVGMLTLSRDAVIHVIGRTVLCIDLFFFTMRVLQLLMVFEELGLMLVMVRKMVKDTANFMFILLIFVFAYAVSSEAIRGKMARDHSFEEAFLIIRKAYWQVFGELFLDEISASECGVVGNVDCQTGNATDTSFRDEGTSVSNYRYYAVPIMLGIYVMITNVLLLNLLIARFNKTFEEVHDQAVEYHSWHRSLIIIEFHHRPHLPPPFNLLRLVYGCVGYSFIALCSVFLRFCCSAKNDDSGPDIQLEDLRKKKKDAVRRLEEDQTIWSRNDANARLIMAIDKKSRNQNSLVMIYKKLDEIQHQIAQLKAALEDRNSATAATIPLDINAN